MFLTTELLRQRFEGIGRVIGLAVLEVLVGGFVAEDELQVGVDQDHEENAESQRGQHDDPEYDYRDDGPPAHALHYGLYPDDHPVDAGPEDHDEQESLGGNIEEVVEVVLLRDARPDPRTVVIELLHAVVTDVAVGRSRRPVDLFTSPRTLNST
mgnify:FL=1